MIEQQALVIQLQGDKAVIEVQRQSGCQQCELSGGCGTGSLGRLLGYRKQLLTINNSAKLKTGDKVIVGLPEAAYLSAGFLIYLMPIICLFLFAIVADTFFGSRDWLNVVAAVIGLASGLAIAGRISSRSSAQHHLEPRLIRQIW